MAKTQEYIHVVDAHEHNLKHIDVSIPKNTLTVITGPSGSGKSSLALDVLYTEGKRRYMESLSSYARQFLGIAKKPDVGRIDGLCPAIAIEQKTVGSNPRSTVGTITEVYDYFRILFARVGRPFCPTCKTEIIAHAPNEVAHVLAQEYAGKQITIAAPIAKQKKGEFVHELLDIFEQGYYRFVIDGTTYKFKHQDDITQLKLRKTYKHDIDVLLDRVTVDDESKARVEESVAKSFDLAQGSVKIIADEKEQLYSCQRMCMTCNSSFPELEPRLFSFNSPVGACTECSGLGVVYNYQQSPWDSMSASHGYALYTGREISTCRACLGTRLNAFAQAVLIDKKNIYQLGQLSIAATLQFVKALHLPETKQEIAENVLKEITNRLQFLVDVGLGYLSLNRTARTLSGGEGQRIRLAKQVGCALSGVLYVLDEPSIGLHQRDNDRLIATLHSLRDLGNTVLVVEHDLDTMRMSDWIIDMGPAAGVHGGKITAQGTPKQIVKDKNSLTGHYLSGAYTIELPEKRRDAKGWLTLEHANKNNLKDVTAEIPLGGLCCVTGVSGSGKSTLIFQELIPALQAELKASKARRTADALSDLSGAEHIENLVTIDQNPIGRTSRSNPATYIGIFDVIRRFFASVPESKVRGYDVGRFSFNVKAGRCAACRGEGIIRVSMHFLPDVVMTCKKCKGKRYNAQTLEIRYKNKTIADVLEMTAVEALEFFKSHTALEKRLRLLCDVGLDYIKLGQPSTTLSGGESQRIKLVNELAKRGKHTLYILDEPTTGLHNHDIAKLLDVLQRLVNKGNSLVVIEHNLDVIKTADWIIDLGPEGGDAGGYIVAAGTPETVVKEKKSFTGKYLKPLLKVSKRK